MASDAILIIGWLCSCVLAFQAGYIACAVSYRNRFMGVLNGIKEAFRGWTEKQ